MPDFTHATLKEIDQAIASRKLSKSRATTILKARAANDSASGRRAAHWLQSQGKPVPTVKVTPVVVPLSPKAEKAAKATKQQAWVDAATLCEQRNQPHTGPKGGPTPFRRAAFGEIMRGEVEVAS